jgi:hypothetical protein
MNFLAKGELFFLASLSYRRNDNLYILNCGINLSEVDNHIEKYSRQFTSEGLEYIKKAHQKTKVIKIVTESFSGKANR